MPQLPDTLTQQIRDLCADGYTAYDQSDFKQALRQFYQAWLLLPKPQSQWEAAGWILAALGDAYFRLKQYPQAVEALNSARFCPGTQNHPFILLRLGQALLDSGQITQARQHLHSAYCRGSANLFQQEPPRYLNVISDLISSRTSTPSSTNDKGV